jgi:hypothetical protein
MFLENNLINFLNNPADIALQVIIPTISTFYAGRNQGFK